MPPHENRNQASGAFSDGVSLNAFAISRPTLVSDRHTTSSGIARIASADRGLLVSQRDLSLSNNQIGDVLVAEGDSAGALSAYRQGLEIIDRLAKTDLNNVGWQRDLAYSYN